MQPGTRVEETARTADQVEGMLRKIIPANQLEGIIDNLGIPSALTFRITRLAP